MNAPIVHLFEVPELRPAAAQPIHETFWTDAPGASAEAMAQRLAQAAAADRVPLCRVAVHGAEVVGVVNLVENDDAQHTEWRPWLAGLVVEPDWRGRGLGSRLVRTLLADARRLGVARVHFGTDAPGFDTRLGAAVHARLRADFCYMGFELQAAQAG